MKTVFLVINSLYGGGAENVASKLSQIWSKCYNLYIISLAEQTEEDYNFAGEIIEISDSFVGRTWIEKINKSAKRIDALAEIIKPDVIIGFLHNSSLCVVKTKYNSRKIISVRNYLHRQYSGLKLLITELMIRHFYKKADVIVSVSKAINNDMIERYHIDAKKCLTIYNPVDIQSIENKMQEKLSDAYDQFFKCHRVFINVAHIGRQKGQFHLVRITNELKKLFPNIGLIIVGKDTGEYANKLRNMIEQYNLNDSVLLTGLQKNPFQFIAHSELFIFPSLFEGFPNSLVEAMTCGIPVVAADCLSGPREILLNEDENKEYGFLMPDDQTEWINYDEPLTAIEIKYVEKIRNLLNNKEIQCDYALRSKMRAKDFSENAIFQQWNDIINQ